MSAQQENNITPENSNTENPNEATASMNTLSALINKVVKDGYTDSFKVTKKGLYSNSTDKYFGPQDVKVNNFYRFEGESDPSDNAIMYVIETSNGGKGTLVDAYGTYADDSVNKFMAEVEEINKKMKGAGEENSTTAPDA